MPCDHSRPAVQEVYQIHLGLFIYTSGSEDRHGGPALNTLLVLNEDTSDSEKTIFQRWPNKVNCRETGRAWGAEGEGEAVAGDKVVKAEAGGGEEEGG